MVHYPRPSSSSSSSLHHPSSHPQPTHRAFNPPQAFELSPILLVSTLDGQLHALDRQTGIWNWSLTDPNPNSQLGLLDPQPLIDSPPRSDHHHHLHHHHELYAIEPHDDGHLYLFLNSPSEPSRLEKLPLSVSQLVDLSPFTLPGDSSKMFIGKKDTHLIAIDLRTGRVVNILHSQPNRSSSNPKQTSRGDQCHPHRSFPLSPPSADLNTSPIDPTHSNSLPSITSDDPHPSIDQRPRDLLYIGRTDYQVSIYSKPHTLIQTLRYSTYSPSNLPHSLQSMWTRTPDELYLEPTHDGNLVCFQAMPPIASHPSTPPERPQIKWQNSFDHPVASVFDIVFPNSPIQSTTSVTPNPNLQDPGPTQAHHRSADEPSQATMPVQQPIIFLQPKFLSSQGDRSPSKFSSDDHFDIYQHLHSQTSSSTSSEPRDPTGQRRAFVGKFQDSFYVMSQQSYPLVAFAPSAFQTLGREPSIGTHHLLQPRALSDFTDLALTNRLLDPTIGPHPLRHPSRALDPSPNSLTLPPSPGVDDSQSTENPSLNNPPNPSNITPDPHQASTEKAISSIHLQERAARISSLLVRTFKEQLMLNESETSQSNRLPDLNPLLTLFLVLVVMSWWASRKVTSSSSGRWDHLHHLMNQAPGHDTPKYTSASRSQATGVEDSHDKSLTIDPTTTATSSQESIDSSNPEGSGHRRLPTGSDLLDSQSALPKQKPKRRRGKRPGQKAAAAAAKAEAEAAAKTLLVSPPIVPCPPPSDPVDLIPTASKAPPSRSELESSIEPKLNTKKSRPSLASGIQRSHDLSKVVSLPTSAHDSKHLETTPDPLTALLRVEVDHVEDHDALHPNENSGLKNPPNGLEPQRVGSLIVTNETIGYGSHGTVVLRGTFQGRQVAVKRLLKDFVTLASHEVSLLQESDDHPNVVRYFVKESLDNFLYIALELCNASLFDLIERRQFKEYEELDRIFNAKKALKQITSGLRYLHKLKIVHRDIKPQNILISITRPLAASSKASHRSRSGALDDKKFRMLISDFGLCKKLELDESSFAQTAHHAAGSFGYRAPEILKGQVNLSEVANSNSNTTSSTLEGDLNGSSSGSNPDKLYHRLTRSIDIFSLGCIYYYVLTKGEHPFGSRYEREINILKDEVCLDQLDGFDEEAFEAQQLIRSMIRPNPKERPGAEEVLQNPYFWEPWKRLNFLCDCSDRFEIMDREPLDETLVRLEDQDKFYKYLSHHSIHPSDHHPIRKRTLDWYKVIDRGLVDNLGKYRKYDGGSIRDLLRVMRNKKHHFQDLPDSLKKTLGDVPEGFLNYFSRKFPSLLVHVYEIIVGSHLKFENLFVSYFDTLDDL